MKRISLLAVCLFGLSIAVAVAQQPFPSAETVKIAGWQDSDRTSLVPHEPEPTDVVIALDGQGPNGAA